MADLDKIYLFRMTHIRNIPHILQWGITHVESVNRNEEFVPIGDPSLITTRNNFRLENGRKLGEYIPFYFGVRMPMLYVIQNGYNLVTSSSARNIVYCVTSVKRIIDLNLDYIFTDGHAVDSFTMQYGPTEIDNYETLVDVNAINARYWKDESDLDLKRRKEAEFLVKGDIAPSALLGYLVYNQEAKNELLTFGVQEANIWVRPNFYF